MKLTQQEREEIVQLRRDRVPSSVIEQRYGITRQTVWLVVKDAVAYDSTRPQDDDYQEPETPRDIDGRVAEYVMGWPFVTDMHPQDVYGITRADMDAMKPHGNVDDVPYTRVPDYSTNAADSKAVIEVMRRHGFQFQLHSIDNEWWAEFAKQSYRIGGQATTATIERSVALAAIEAKLCESRVG